MMWKMSKQIKKKYWQKSSSLFRGIFFVWASFLLLVRNEIKSIASLPASGIAEKRGNTTFKLKWTKIVLQSARQREREIHDFDTLWVSPFRQHYKLKFFYVASFFLFVIRFTRLFFFLLSHLNIDHSKLEACLHSPFMHIISHAPPNIHKIIFCIILICYLLNSHIIRNNRI